MPPSPSPTTRVAAGITYAKIPTAARQPERGGEETTEATWPLRPSPTPRLHARPPDALPHHQGRSCARPLSPTPDTARATPDPRLAALGGGGGSKGGGGPPSTSAIAAMPPARSCCTAVEGRQVQPPPPQHPTTADREGPDRIRTSPTRTSSCSSHQPPLLGHLRASTLHGNLGLHRTSTQVAPWPPH
jgi:hypothetical protein